MEESAAAIRSFEEMFEPLGLPALGWGAGLRALAQRDAIPQQP